MAGQGTDGIRRAGSVAWAFVGLAVAIAIVGWVAWKVAVIFPPLMLFPRMPRSAFLTAGAPLEGPYFEVLVDQRGGVEAVRLRGREQPGQTFYRARMMLSAAKAWQFEPARIEGRPVRYVVRVIAEQ